MKYKVKSKAAQTPTPMIYYSPNGNSTPDLPVPSTNVPGLQNLDSLVPAPGFVHASDFFAPGLFQVVQPPQALRAGTRRRHWQPFTLPEVDLLKIIEIKKRGVCGGRRATPLVGFVSGRRGDADKRRPLEIIVRKVQVLKVGEHGSRGMAHVWEEVRQGRMGVSFRT